MKENHLHVEIEATNICNTRCLHCPHEAISRPVGKMDWDTYQTVIDKVSAGSHSLSVEYAGMGEPLLNPEIYRFISYVSARGATKITTNASALTEQNIAKLVEVGLSNITISFNGTDKELYELMMGGLSFERAQQHLDKLMEMTRDAPLTVAANVSVTRHTQGRLREIKGYLNERGINHISFSKCHSRGGFLKSPAVCTTPMPARDRYRCDIFTNTLFVSWTGIVLSCCHDLSGVGQIGNLREETLEAILEKKDKINAQGVKFDICKSCNDLYRFMFDITPDGRPIADWIYTLYTGNAEEEAGGPVPADLPAITPPVQKAGLKDQNSLTEWLYDIYLQEGQLSKLLSYLSGSIVEKERQNQELWKKMNEQQARFDAVLQDIYSSRGWRFLQRLKRVHQALIPLGSRRDRFYQKIIKPSG